jgi:hypothetical protein
MARAGFGGKQRSLGTTSVQAAMRREMALKRHGAMCEVFDGNYLTELGPDASTPRRCGHREPKPEPRGQ